MNETLQKIEKLHKEIVETLTQEIESGEIKKTVDLMGNLQTVIDDAQKAEIKKTEEEKKEEEKKGEEEKKDGEAIDKLAKTVMALTEDVGAISKTLEEANLSDMKDSIKKISDGEEKSKQGKEDEGKKEIKKVKGSCFEGMFEGNKGE